MIHAIKNSHNIQYQQPRLPKYDNIYVTKDVTFEIYRAKNLYDTKWRHPSLKKLVCLARTSYRRYGARSLLDRHDEKAAIYLVRATYMVLFERPSKGSIKNRKKDEDKREDKSEDKKQIKKQLVHEWLSVRMVPGDGHFNGVGELELYRRGGVDVTELFRKKIGSTKGAFWKHVISDSRLCGIHPHTISKLGGVSYITPEKHNYSSESMALMQAQFMIDHAHLDLPFTHVTAIVRPEIRDRVITDRKGMLIKKPTFIPAWKTLDIPPRERLTVDRNVYSYHYPRYWLDMEKLKLLLATLLHDKKISQRTIDYYCKSTADKTAKMLTARGKLVGATLTGDELRDLVDRHVPDAPELQITPIGVWRKSFLKMLQGTDIDVVKKHPELRRFLSISKV